jgi:tetratricopeptide (TPR) repeat protein
MLHSLLTGVLMLGDMMVASPAVDSVEVYYATRDYASVVRLLEPRSEPRKREKLLLGWSHYRLGQMQEAKRAFEAGLLVAPASIDLMNGLAFAHHRLGEPKDAELAFKRVLARNPERTESLRGLAFVYFTSGRFEEGLPLFDQMWRQHPDDSEMEYYLLKSVDGLLSGWHRAGRTPAQMVEAAWVYAADGHRRSAVEMFRWVVERNPFHPGARLGVGTLGPAFGYEAEALEALESVLREDPHDAEARAALARLHLYAGRREQAAEQVETILSADPDDPRGLALRREISKRNRRSTP